MPAKTDCLWQLASASQTALGTCNMQKRYVKRVICLTRQQKLGMLLSFAPRHRQQWPAVICEVKAGGEAVVLPAADLKLG